MEIQEIQKIIDLMNENDLSYFFLEQGGTTLKLKRGVEPVAAPPAPVAATVVENVAPVTVPDKGQEISSPMVGTFYRSSSPDSDPFVQVGDLVEEDTTVCIIEAMKVMNEIKADAKGVIKRIVAEEGKPVQYGQALFVISPA